MYIWLDIDNKFFSSVEKDWGLSLPGATSTNLRPINPFFEVAFKLSTEKILLVVHKFAPFVQLVSMQSIVLSYCERQYSRF